MSEKQAYPSDQADKVLVRMPDGMRDRLKQAAKINNRTMNAEIVARLEQSLKVDTDKFDKMFRSAVLQDEISKIENITGDKFGNQPTADEIADKVVERQRDLLGQLLNQQKISTIESLRAQLAIHQEEIRQLHNPLACALEELENANKSTDADAISAAQIKLTNLKQRLAELDELCDGKMARISAIRDQLLPLASTVHPFADAILKRQTPQA